MCECDGWGVEPRDEGGVVDEQIEKNREKKQRTKKKRKKKQLVNDPSSTEAIRGIARTNTEHPPAASLPHPR